MTKKQSDAAKRHFDVICWACGGTGRIINPDMKAKVRAAGNSTYLKSLEAGQMSMSERGRKGGRPKRPKLSELEAG